MKTVRTPHGFLGQVMMKSQCAVCAKKTAKSDMLFCKTCGKKWKALFIAHGKNGPDTADIVRYIAAETYRAAMREAAERVYHDYSDDDCWCNGASAAQWFTDLAIKPREARR